MAPKGRGVVKGKTGGNGGKVVVKDAKKQAANEVTAASTIRMKLGSKRQTKHVDESGKDVPAPQLQPMDATHLKQMCSWLEWHGVKKSNPDADVRKLLNQFQNADPQEKRQLLSGFQNNKGKLIAWAKKMTIQEISQDDTETGSVADFFFRTVGPFFVRELSLLRTSRYVFIYIYIYIDIDIYNGF